VAVAERLFSVPAGAFAPRPKVDSAVLRLTPLEEPLVGPPDHTSFRRLVVGLFGFRRKQLGRGLRELTGWEPGRALDALDRARLAPDARPDTVGVEGFVRLLGALVDGGWAAP
jgi:16S rRNA (adenine1518-N6/adenine1519-N6)-dimethyltransferase